MKKINIEILNKPTRYDILIGKQVNKDVKKGTAFNWKLLNGNK